VAGALERAGEPDGGGGASVKRLATSALATLAVCAPAPALADPGDRDRSFGGGDGVLRIQGVLEALGPLVMRGDGIVVGDATDRTLRRLTPSGRRDRRFGDDGIAALPPEVLDPREIVRHGDGIVVAGGATGTLTLTRLTGRGDVDRSFGDRGTVMLRGAWHGVRDLAVTPRGEVLATFYSSRGFVGRTVSYVARLTRSGRLDPGFGDGGIARLFDVQVERVFAGPDASVLVVAQPFPGSKAEIARLTRTGAVDADFARIGLPSGFVLLGGAPQGELAWITPRGSPPTAARLRADGTLVPLLGPATAGTQTFVPTRWNFVAFEPRGRLTYSVSQTPFGITSPPGIAIRRLTTLGRRDRGFGHRGEVRLARRGDRTTGETPRLETDGAGRLVALSQRRVDESDREDIGGFDDRDRSFALLARLESGVALVKLRSARRVRGGVRVAVACLRPADLACRGTVTLTDARRRVVGRRRIRTWPGASADPYRIRFSRRPRGRLVAVARITDGQGTLSTNRRRVR
jgi:hypothetical protein